MPSPRTLGALGALAALALCAAPAPARAENVEFYATVSSPEVAVGDTVTWQIVLSSGVQTGAAQVDLPVLADFDLVSKSRSTSTSINLGGAGSQINHQAILTVVLAPKRAGNLTIPPARVQVGGQEYSTATLSVKALPAGSAPPKPRAQRQPPPDQDPDPFQQFFGGNPFAGMPQGNPNLDPFDQMLGEGGPPKDTDLFLRSSVDKKQVYLGEQVTLSVYLFSRVDVSAVENFKLPKLDAFWAEEIETPSQISGEVRNVNGVPYRVYLLRRRALFPLKAGKQTVDPAEVDVATGISIFGNGHKSHRASQATEVAVLPLPTGAPAGFEATNVGSYKLTLQTSPPTTGVVHAQVGQPVTLQLTLEGAGNFKNLSLPKLPAVRGLKVFDPTTTDKVQIKAGRFGGKRTLEFLAMPEQTGRLTLPAVELSFFHPESKTYETARTEPVELDVTAGAGGAVAAGNPAAVSQPTGTNVLSAGLLKPIHTTSDNRRLSFVGEPLYRRGLFFPLLLLPAGLYAFGALGGRMRAQLGKDDPARRVRTAQSRARKRFKGAEELLEGGDSAAYYGQVAKAVNDYLTDKLGLAAAGLTRDELGKRLADAGAKPESVGALMAVLEACDLGRFAPGATAARRKVLDDAAAAVEALEAQKLKRPSAEVTA